jgi:hypothetical protein
VLLRQCWGIICPGVAGVVDDTLRERREVLVELVGVVLELAAVMEGGI